MSTLFSVLYHKQLGKYFVHAKDDTGLEIVSKRGFDTAEEADALIVESLKAICVAPADKIPMPKDRH